MAKYQFQIKTGDFEYIMGECEAADPKVAVEGYYALKKAYYTGNGLSSAEFNAIYDSLRTTGNIVGDPGIISKMSMAQQFALNELKKSLKR
jgi:hypothetical protein